MTVLHPSKEDLKHTKKNIKGMRFSIRTKITVWVGLCIALVSLVLIGYSVITLRQMSIESATREASSLAAAESELVLNQLNLPLYTARAVAQFLSTIKDPSNPVALSRDQVNGMLRTLLVNNPSFLGTYTLWEPNQLDGQDAIYAGAVGHDATGRFIPYWVRDDAGIIHVEALAQYETPGVGDWYLQPRSTKKEVTLAPLIYPIQGKDVVMASFVVPIVQDQKFYGVAGVDAPIGFVQQIVDDVDLYDGTTNAVLFSDAGTLIAVRQQPELTNQPASLIYPDFDEIQPTLGSAFTRLSADGKYLQIFSPIDIGDTGTHWIIGLIIPFEKITAAATSAAIRQVTIGTALMLLALAVLWFLAGQIIRPIQVLTDAAQAVTQGNWNVTADVHSHDEAEVLANTFNLMTSELQNLFGSLEQRVEERTKALASVAEVGTATSTILDIDILLQQVVDLAKERFDLYHAHTYLLNDTGNALILSSGAGNVGQQMVAEGRSIPLDSEQSLVARAARDKKGVAVNDVTLAPDFLPNPLLPATRSELAVPMMVGDRVIGVFDVQSEIIGRFTEADIAVQTTLAAQIASAVQNARLYSQTRDAQQLTRSVIDSTDDWIFIKDQDHRYQLVNQGYANSLHIPIADFIGRNDLELGFPEELVKGNPEKGIRGFWADDRSVMDGGVTKQIPDDFVTIDGNIRVFDTVKVPLRDANNKVWGVLAFARDMTERRNLEELNRKRATKQEALNQITQKIQNTTSIEAALQIAARELGHALGMKSTLVTLEPEALIGEHEHTRTTEPMETGVSQ